MQRRQVILLIGRKFRAALLAAFCCACVESGSNEAAGQTAIANTIVDDVTAVAPIRSRRHSRIDYRLVYFATNRPVDIGAVDRARRSADTVPLPTDAVFPESVSSGMAYGWADVSYPAHRKRGHTGYNSDSRAQNPYRDFIVDDYDLTFSREEFLSLVRQSNEKVPKSSLVYIHGFDVSFENAAERTAQMSLDIGSDAVPIFFSWPSAHEVGTSFGDGMFQLVTTYSFASNNSKQSRPFVGAFLSQIASFPWPYRVIAHSMGADITGNALLTSYLYDRYAVPRQPIRPPETISLVAPDIAERDFADQLGPILLSGNSRVTVYCTNDWALWASKLYNGSTRLGWCGTEGRLVPGVDVAVVRGRMTDVLRHSYFLGSIRMLDDIGELLGGTQHRPGIRQINLN